MSEERETLIVASKTKAFIKSQGCMVSADALDQLNNKIYELIENAVKRTKENKRSTLRSHDF
jgi:histone H3/H4